jgi:MoaD family protein
MKVYIPTPLRSYTGKESVIEAGGATVREMLAEIELHYPGFRFRIIDEQGAIREHIKIFVNEKAVQSLSTPLQAGDTVHIMCALSGG